MNELLEYLKIDLLSLNYTTVEINKLIDYMRYCLKYNQLMSNVLDTSEDMTRIQEMYNIFPDTIDTIIVSTKI